jgi:hypothetical protein
MNPSFVVAVCVSTMGSQVHFAGVEILVHVCEIRGCNICAVVQENLQIESIVTVLVCLRNGYAVESDRTLTEQGVEELLATAVVSVKYTTFPSPRPIFFESRV